MAVVTTEMGARTGATAVPTGIRDGIWTGARADAVGAETGSWAGTAAQDTIWFMIMVFKIRLLKMNRIY